VLAWTPTRVGVDANTYPFGNTFDPGKQNSATDRASGRCMTTSAGRLASWVYDLGGNVREQEQSRDQSHGSNDVCRNRGGSSGHGEADLGWDASPELARTESVQVHGHARSPRSMTGLRVQPASIVASCRRPSTP